MRWASLTGSAVAGFITCGLATGAGALPLAGTEQAVAPQVQFAAHKPNEWLFHGHWWRPGPWSDHVIYGVVNPQRPGAMFLPWGAEWLHYCAAKYRSFDPASGTYVTWQGERRVCR